MHRVRDEEYLVEHLKRISAADGIILDKILMTYDEILFFFFPLDDNRRACSEFNCPQIVFTRPMNGRTDDSFVDTRDTVEFLIILTTSVANGIINAKNNEHLESRIENLPDGRQSLLTEGDEREILRDKCNRVRRDAFESARHAILSYGDRVVPRNETRRVYHLHIYECPRA